MGGASVTAGITVTGGAVVGDNVGDGTSVVGGKSDGNVGSVPVVLGARVEAAVGVVVAVELAVMLVALLAESLPHAARIVIATIILSGARWWFMRSVLSLLRYWWARPPRPRPALRIRTGRVCSDRCL